ncbi:hypothetical protein BSKO_13600 [Bryopsis sp. KO-2023]|nr:hypothetical protein BSKO_13600 [Bryopsis sp. KO-2023]
MPIAKNVLITDLNGKKHINLRPASPEFRALLSIDGGGVRGIIPAIVLDGFIKAAKEVLRETYPECADLTDDDMIVEVKDCFDTVAGNSAGSILALYFASAGGRPDLYEAGGRLEGHCPGSTEAIIELFDQLVNVIFKLPALHWGRIPVVRKISGVFASMYGYRGLEQGLHEVFGDLTLKQLKMNAYIPAYELNNSRPVAFYCRERTNGDMETGYSSPKNPTHKLIPRSVKVPFTTSRGLSRQYGGVKTMQPNENVPPIPEAKRAAPPPPETQKGPEAKRPAPPPPTETQKEPEIKNPDPKDEEDETFTPRPTKCIPRSFTMAGGVFPDHFDNSNLILPVKTVAQASASAPVYFSSTNVDQEKAGINLAEGSMISWVDGGVVSNNPTMQALAFMASSFYNRRTGEMFPMSKMAVLSVGTGTAKSYSNVTRGKDGLVWWLSSLLTILMDSHAEVNHAIVDALFDGAVFGQTDAAYDRYVRINKIAFPGDKEHKVLGALDAVSEVPKLKHIGEHLVDENWDIMKNFVKNILLAEKTPPSE